MVVSSMACGGFAFPILDALEGGLHEKGHEGIGQGSAGQKVSSPALRSNATAMKKMELTDADEQQLIEEVFQLGFRLCQPRAKCFLLFR